ncbi:MAG: ribonuclease P protein component [Inquilinus sp.]|uniref:ribonuclease P protein component n=1 Tax=Inquilinus sp. TaxID=1932117 RepID=UPI003F3FEB5B
MRVRLDDPSLIRLGRLKKRAEFLAVAGTRRKWAQPGVIVQLRRWDQAGTDAEATAGCDLRVGYTASRKVGNSVARNRARRRLRAAAAEVLGRRAAPGLDLVLIARGETIRRPFADLVADLDRALQKLGAVRPAPEVGGAEAGEAAA